MSLSIWNAIVKATNNETISRTDQGETGWICLLPLWRQPDTGKTVVRSCRHFLTGDSLTIGWRLTKVFVGSQRIYFQEPPLDLGICYSHQSKLFLTFPLNFHPKTSTHSRIVTRPQCHQRWCNKARFGTKFWQHSSTHHPQYKVENAMACEQKHLNQPITWIQIPFLTLNIKNVHKAQVLSWFSECQVEAQI